MEKSNKFIKIEEAKKKKLCSVCNFSNYRFKKSSDSFECNYHIGDSLNYRNVPEGHCALYIKGIVAMTDELRAKAFKKKKGQKFNPKRVGL
jgi:hypothetical protein